MEASKRLGGGWPDGAPKPEKLGKAYAAKSTKAIVSDTTTYFHDEIRAHPFFEGHRGLQLHKASVPVPTLTDLTMRELMQRVRKEGGAALGPPAAITKWAEPFRTRVGFECLKREILTGEMRESLGWGPAPAPLVDDLEEFEREAKN